jgi:hypothetical protein
VIFIRGWDEGKKMVMRYGLDFFYRREGRERRKRLWWILRVGTGDMKTDF